MIVVIAVGVEQERTLTKKTYHIYLFCVFQELHPRYSDHPKFRNYAFDVREFMRLVERTVKKVRQSIDEYTKKRGS